ncbi:MULTISPECIES: HU family DNA-binding protein [unclassified Cetobacterium]|uniref:HU family DNA-binding protein n=1 Tax=unclassified Cetobacterium TaxID=2630983 RepID=UPI00163B8057|nr:HU family DNA-binding protein [Cetobacterium sp. 8H]MBC2851891.1 HU family DNA-binding protein [Cetobacterium sp. 8H]
MTKKEFIDLFAKTGDYTKKDAEKAVKLFLDLVEQKLVEGEPVSFIGWGKFEVVTRAARAVRNPQTGKKMKLKEKKVVKFRVGKTLEEKIV